MPYTGTGYNKFYTKEGYPAVAPPWGTLNAINLSTGDLVWKDTLGDYPELKAKAFTPARKIMAGLQSQQVGCCLSRLPVTQNAGIQ